MKAAWYSKKWVTISLHVLFWGVLFILPTLLRPSYENNHHPGPAPTSTNYQYHNLINFVTWIALFYWNSLVLIPKLFYKRNYAQYAGALGGTIWLLFLMNWLSFHLLLPEFNFQIKGFIFFYFFPCIFFIACSTAYRMFRDKMSSDKIAAEKETENLKTELSFLRSQVSPHFMFNVMNNMVALARKGSTQLEPSLIKLSSLLRYMLYETDETKVPLEKEVEYLKNYIDLQNQRFGKSIQLNVCFGEIDKNYLIEPMLLIPFVENAFKHGTGSIDNPEIDIELKAKNNMLHFLVRNKTCGFSQEEKDKTSGIGLVNVKRRLNLLYGKSQSLLINDTNEWYSVSLQLTLP